MLTRRQRDTLQAIDAHIDETGRAPSIREIAARIGAPNKSTVQGLLIGLETRGVIKRRPYARIERTHFYRWNDETKALDRWG